MTSKARKSLKTSGKVARFVLTERILTIITRVFDGVLFSMIYMEPTVAGALKAFALLTPIHLVMSALTVAGIDFLLNRGIDITGIEEFREMAAKKHLHHQWVRRFTSWILRRRFTIFAIGSWFYVDPDYVTLLLRKREDGFWANTLRITLPSVILAMVVWTPLCFGAVKGVAAAVWIWEMF